MKNEIEKRILERKNLVLETAKTDLNHWMVKEIMPKGKNNYTLEYVEKRAEKFFSKELQKELTEFEAVLNAPNVKEITINIEWAKSKTWGANPTATAQIWLDNGRFENFSYKCSGCGYDKESTVFAGALNQSKSIIKLLLELPENNLYGYFKRADFLPHLSGGVGTSCYPSIFDLAGYKMAKTANGKMFDSWRIEIKK
jgi:hypothetical protein